MAQTAHGRRGNIPVCDQLARRVVYPQRHRPTSRKLLALGKHHHFSRLPCHIPHRLGAHLVLVGKAALVRIAVHTDEETLHPEVLCALPHHIHNGLTVLEETHKLLHGEKVAFGAVTQLVLENRPLDEIEEIVLFCKECGLPTTLADLGLENVTDERLMAAATESCAENDTMTNMPFEVTPADVFAAMKAADRLASQIG